MPTRTGALALALTVGTILAGCGVPAQDEPARIERERLPAAIQRQDRTTPAPATTRRPASVSPELYFTDRDRLVGVERDLGTGSPRRRLARATRLLIAGPTQTEQGSRLSTAIPPGLSLTVVDLQNGRATLELVGELRHTPSAEIILAIGQIVLTTTAVTGVDRVTLIRDGQVLQAPRADGSLASNPLTEADYMGLLQAGTPPR